MFCRINFSWAGSSERWLFFTVLKHFETSTETTAKEELGGGSSWFILFLISRFRPAGYIFQNFRPWIMKHAPTCLLNDALRGFVHAVWSFGGHHTANIVCITRWGLTLSFLQPRCNPRYSQTINHYVRTNAVFFLCSWIATEMSHDKRKWLPSAMWIHLLWSYSQHHQECYKAFWLK